MWNIKVSNLTLIVIFILLILPSCTSLSNRDYVQEHSIYRGTRRIVVFLQRWPCYLQKPHQSELGEEFITKKTPFYGAWKPAERIKPRTIDVVDIDDQMVGDILVQVLEKKGYQVFMADVAPKNTKAETVADLMARYQALDRDVDAFLFCFYSPTLYFAHAELTPKDHGKRPYSLGEIVRILESGNGGIIWSGPRAGLSPKKSISHAFVYLSISCFKALNWKPFWEVADSQVGGEFTTWLPQCYPDTDLDYWADSAMIQRLMCQNLICRLRHIVPYAF